MERVAPLPPSSWIEPFVDELQRPAFRLAVVLCGDYHLAEEIVQDAFLRVWLSPRTPREMPQFRLYLYKTIVNLVRDHQRRRARWGRIRIDRAATADPVAVSEGRERDAEVGEAMKGLTRREQEALYVRFFEDAPYEDVARIIGTRHGAARVLVHRALKKLRRHLEPAAMAEVITP